MYRKMSYKQNLRGLGLFSLKIRKLKVDVITVFKLVDSCEVNGNE